MRRKQRRAGFTLVEMGVVLAIVAAITAMAVPSLNRFFANQRLSDAARTVAGALSYARGESIRTGNVHLVYFGTDEGGIPLEDASANPVDVMVVDDGRPGSAGQNCSLDGGEPFVTYKLEDGVAWGVTQATGTVDTDAGSAAITDGTTLRDAGGNPARWLLFRPEGPATAFSADCTQGGVGSGGGAVYLNNGVRDVAVVVTPLGTTRIHGWMEGGWSQ